MSAESEHAGVALQPTRRLEERRALRRLLPSLVEVFEEPPGTLDPNDVEDAETGIDDLLA